MAVELYYKTLFLDSNLTSYFRLNSSLVEDSKGTATLTNNSVSNGTGLFDGAADFGSSNSSKTLSNASAMGITTTGARTFSFWYKLGTDISTGKYGLFQHGVSGLNAQWYIRYEYNGGTRRLAFVKLKQGIGFVEIFQNATLGTGWNHLALVFDGTNMTGYINGSATSSTNATGGNAGGGSGISIGADVEGNYTPGLIDDFSVFSRALSGAEITDIYSGTNLRPMDSGSPMLFGGGVTIL